ncbi:pre-rRNA processing protein [Microbotryomycetes sp. JL221]|nr:pre-rRNA processing protein [Microbotryomycetes sp. JL221]
MATLDRDDSDQLELALSKVRQQTTAGVAAVKRPAVLLVAVEQTLTSTQPTIESSSSKHARPTPQAYFVALVSTLTQLTASSTTADQRQLVEASLYLLAIVTKHLDKETLKLKASTLLPLVQQLFETFATQAPAVKSLIQLGQSLLSTVPSKQLERDQHCRQVYATVLQLCSDARPKVRRRAQEAIIALIQSPPPPTMIHHYKSETSKWIVDKLTDCVKATKRGHNKKQQSLSKGQAKAQQAAALVVGGADDSQNGGEESKAISLLTFIKNLGSAWSDDCNADLLPVLLSVLTLSSQHLTLSALTLLSHLFSAAREQDSISSNSVQDTLLALIASEPRNIEGENGEKLMAGWIEGVGEGLVALARTNADEALEQATSIFDHVLPMLSSASTLAMRQAVETTLSLITKHCISDKEVFAALSIIQQTKHKKSDAQAKQGQTLLDMIDNVNKALTSPRFAAQAQPHVLALAKSLFLRLRLRPIAAAQVERPSPVALTLLRSTLEIVGSQRQDDHFEWKKEAEQVIDAAIKVCGPQVVLEVLPLGLEQGANPARARAWLLPLLKPAVTNTKLNHFKQTFVPLSADMFNKAESARTGGRAMEAKVWDTLVAQIWSLLPGYCEYALDVVEAFNNDFIAMLANIVYTQPVLRPSIFKALSTIVQTTTTLARSCSPPDILKQQFGLTPQDGQHSLTHLQSLASTVLGMAFNVYGKMSRGDGAYILTTVGDWVSILSASDLESTYDRVETLLIQALDSTSSSTATNKKEVSTTDNLISPTHALFDILITFIPYANPIEKRFFDLAMSDKVLSNNDQSIQKKGYRVMSRLAEERNGSVLSGRIDQVVETVVEGQKQVAQGAKRDRTILLSTIVPLIPSDALHIIPSLIPEAVLGTKESNERTREAAYDLIVSMGNKMKQGGLIKRHLIKGMEDEMTDEAPASVQEFVTMVSAGLAGTSPHMISATITSLSRLAFEFHDELEQEMLTEVLATIVVFLSSPNREIVRSSIGFVKVAVVSFPNSIVEPQLEELVPALINWSHEHSNHFKVKVRHLLERLIRKFGFDKIEKVVPKDDRKLVNNIRKRTMRSKKKKLAAEEDQNDNMSDAEDAPKPQTSKSAYDEVLYGSDSDVSDSGDEREKPTTSSSKPEIYNRKTIQRKLKQQREGAEPLIHEDENEVLDLLDDRMMSKISAARQAKGLPRKPLDSHFKTDKTSGKIRFEEDSSDSEVDSQAQLENSKGMGAYMEAMHGQDGHVTDAKGRVKFNKTQGKRSRGDEDADEDGDVPVTAGLKELEVTKKRKKVRQDKVAIGGEFKAKRAGGDVKKNGMQPYAYVPLSQVGGKKANNSRGPKVNITGLKTSGKKK